MPSFVIIFRQGPRELTEAEKLQRQREISAWVREHITHAHRFEPRILDAEALPAPGEPPPAGAGSTAGPVIALLFLEAHDLAEAGRLAAAHPGRKFGATVEVRRWSHPPGFQPGVTS